MAGLILQLMLGFGLPLPFGAGERFLTPTRTAASGVYASLTNGSLSLILNSSTANRITSNDNWSGVPSVEGYEGRNLTATHGVDPQTVLGTGAAITVLPSSANTQVHADKGNPNAFNVGGVAEFDTGSPLAYGIQGSGQANPYLVLYVNSVGRSNVTISYDVIDIDGGGNNSVSQVALQYRVGDTGLFTNLPAGFVADATEPNVAGKLSQRTVTLPAAANNEPKVQIRLLTTDAAAPDRTSTPDEWIGINNVVINSAALAPTASTAVVSGRVLSESGKPYRNVAVLMYDSRGEVRMTQTNYAGRYRFEEVPVGEVSIFEVRSKRFFFGQRVQTLLVNEDFDELNFYASSWLQ